MGFIRQPCSGDIEALARQHLNIQSHTRSHATVALGLLHPLMQRMSRAANVGGDRRHRRPPRGMLAFVIQSQPHRFRRELVGRLAWHGSTF